MSRVDVPTLKCDRCGLTTDDLHEMGKFQTITHDSLSKRREWDLCPTDWVAFNVWLTTRTGDTV